MKKISLILIILAAVVTFVSAGVLMSSQINGTKTYCHYNIIVINGMGTCPATN